MVKHAQKSQYGAKRHTNWITSSLLRRQKQTERGSLRVHHAGNKINDRNSDGFYATKVWYQRSLPRALIKEFFPSSKSIQMSYRKIPLMGNTGVLSMVIVCSIQTSVSLQKRNCQILSRHANPSYSQLKIFKIPRVGALLHDWQQPSMTTGSPLEKETFPKFCYVDPWRLFVWAEFCLDLGIMS